MTIELICTFLAGAALLILVLLACARAAKHADEVMSNMGGNMGGYDER